MALSRLWQYVIAILVLNILSVIVWSLFAKSGFGGNEKYDYLLLAIQWAPGICSQKQCYDPLPTRWTLHGLWPTLDDKRDSPEYCESSCTLDPLSGHLESEMKKKWPNLYGEDASFWKNEYCKHGTCCTDILSKPTDYFKAALKLLDIASMNNVLSAAGISPNSGKSHSFLSMDNAVSEILKVKNVKYVCAEVNGKQVLTEMRLCVHRSLSFMVCPSKDTGRTCDKSKHFYLLSDDS